MVLHFLFLRLCLSLGGVCVVRTPTLMGNKRAVQLPPLFGTAAYVYAIPQAGPSKVHAGAAACTLHIE